jgi:5'-methylthioadenosine phosphorylase
MLAIIGGTGLYQFEELEILETKAIKTPFGAPSAPLVKAKYHHQEIIFLPRHGQYHRLLPSEINYRANIWALKSVGATHVISVSAVGSFKEHIRPGDLSVPVQYFDWTKATRKQTFFGDDLVVHVSTARPTCEALVADVIKSAKTLDLDLHTNTTYACVEGPRLGTRAESLFLKGIGCDIVGMTNIPEAFLAREAQLSYCTIAIVTDYDCWLDDPEQHADQDQILKVYQQNITKVKQLLLNLFSKPLPPQSSYCRESLKHAVLTPREKLSDAHKSLLAFLRGEQKKL